MFHVVGAVAVGCVKSSGYLMLSLRTGLNAMNLILKSPFNGQVITKLEVKMFVILEAAPITPK